MSTSTKATNGNDTVDTSFLSSNHKVIHYLQTSAPCATHASDAPMNGLRKTPSHTHDLANAKDLCLHPHPTSTSSQARIRSCSENGSASSVIETLSRSDFSLGSSLSDPGGHYHLFSSNTSSSGICSTSSDVGHEEGTSTSSEDLDFNLGFDQISDSEDIEVADLAEIDDDDECEHYRADKHRSSTTRNNVGKQPWPSWLSPAQSSASLEDTATLLDSNDSNLDARITELEDLLRKSYSLTNMEDGEFNNDDTITANQTKSRQRTSLLHDSTYTLCAQDRFAAYATDADQEGEQTNTGLGVRSHSLGIAPAKRPGALLDKAPKKVVRFADVMVCFARGKIR